MNKIVKHQAGGAEARWSEAEALALRDAARPGRGPGRALIAAEIEQLRHNHNEAADWAMVRVGAKFDPALVQRCRFRGLVRLGNLEPLVLEFDGIRLPVGLYNSTIIDCDLGDNVVLENVSYLAHCVIGNEVILHNIGRMLTTPRARFGHGSRKDGDAEGERGWIEIANENGGRGVLPFAGMLPADAWVWSKFRDDAALMRRLREMTDRRIDPQPGHPGTVGDCTVIRDTRTVVDCKIGAHAYIEGANRLENLTIRSDERESTWIGEATELVDGIVGYGAQVGYGSKALRFVLGTNAKLLFGARMLHSVLGDNSTVACGEVQHSLMFPFHEMHHNNSFLIAATVQGQCNIAAGATIGSNHNSRSLDGELLAGRGFWPGLCSSFKHPCRFASFTLVAKGHYPYELNLPLPFSLLSNSDDGAALQVIPAHWFLYNMYAIARNGWKYRTRDRRVHKEQPIEMRPLAPDTVEEIFTALELLEVWTGKALLRDQAAARGPAHAQAYAREEAKAGGEGARRAEERPRLRELGRELLERKPARAAELTVLAEGIEHSGRPVRVLKVERAWAAYREMVHYYAVDALTACMEIEGWTGPTQLAPLRGERARRWHNLGGLLLTDQEWRDLRTRIVEGPITDWDDVHVAYALFEEHAGRRRARHALASLLALNGWSELDETRWGEALERALATRRRITELTVQSRQKDYESDYRRMTFESESEMEAVLGTIEDDKFVREMREQGTQFELRLARLGRAPAGVAKPAGSQGGAAAADSK